MIMNDRSCDEQFFEYFVNVSKHNVKHLKSFIKISNIKSTLSDVYNLNLLLYQINIEFKNSSLLRDRWNEKLIICERLKKQIKIELKNINNNNLQYLKKINYIKYLRKKMKRNKKKWILNQKHLKEKKLTVMNKIENWIIKKRGQIKKEKERDNLCRDADIVLSDIRAKRNDANKFLITLRELENLRKVKVSIARARGETFFLEADEAFNNLISKLIQQWIALYKEYSMEEKGLNLMIKRDNKQKIIKNIRSIFRNWILILFKNEIFWNDCLEQNFWYFLALRMIWDGYINIIEGFKIPIGWLIPHVSSCTAWKHYLYN